MEEGKNEVLGLWGTSKGDEIFFGFLELLLAKETMYFSKEEQRRPIFFNCRNATVLHKVKKVFRKIVFIVVFIIFHFLVLKAINDEDEKERDL